MRLIDADALIFTHEIARSLDDGHNWNELCITADEIADAPTIEPKHGEWVYDMNQYYKCTNCGHSTLIPDNGSVFVPEWDEYHFCPNCGAEMRKGADDEL